MAWALGNGIWLVWHEAGRLGGWDNDTVLLMMDGGMGAGTLYLPIMRNMNVKLRKKSSVAKFVMALKWPSIDDALLDLAEGSPFGRQTNRPTTQKEQQT